MKYINRWGLMRNTISENISEHSLEVAFIAHALAVIKNTRFNGNVNIERVAVLAMFHDATEILTGDLPTPVKYDNPKIKEAYKEVENDAKNRLLSFLPADLRAEYKKLFFKSEEDNELYVIVKAADRISALIKCIEEKRMGNSDFEKAELSIIDSIEKIDLPEVKCFIEEFLPAFKLTLDEQTK
jgi:5'-deoxynucleotidase